MDDDDFDDYDVGITDEDMLMVLESVESARAAPQTAPPPKARPTVNQLVNRSNDYPAHQAAAYRAPPSACPQPPNGSGTGPGTRRGFSRASSGTLRQTTLFGATVADEPPRPSQQSTGTRPFRADVAEKRTPHDLDWDALQTWVYPTNLGAIRDYQYSIVGSSLYNNTLVALPTGLGKTFIAATVMLNFYRWTRSAQIVFVAPTKPLVAQQVHACFRVAGIPRSETTALNGDVAPGLRADEWKTKRVFFMTPQTLMNDLTAGYADPKNIVLLVVDEAHRSTGEYAYAKVAKFIRRFSASCRVLALTATPGAKIETVQEVIDNLGISHVEIRTEESFDIRQYVHQRNVEQHVLDHSDDVLRVRELLTLALRPLVDKLSQQNIYYARDPMSFTTYGLMQAQKEWFAGQRGHANQAVQNVMRAVFSVLTSVAHSIKLLNFHGIRPFYDNMREFRAETEGKGEKGSKFKRQLVADRHFTEMMDTIAIWLRTVSFVGHPKLAVTTDTVLNHFMDHGAESATKVIVFSEYRDSAEEIVRVLNLHQPMVRATVFVGQADSKRSEGMKQSRQLETIQNFKDGKYNVLVATSIGEEGLDIGQVDVIVCYDASSSPIRMLQRMGRTGRKREGRIVLLLMRGKEEDAYRRSKETYEQMQKLISEGSRFTFRTDLSSRIVPRDVRPEVDMRPVEIPVENTQNDEPPEPKKGARSAKKKPPKKFHVPDGVETGFVKASTMEAFVVKKPPVGRARKVKEDTEEDVAEVPPLAEVVLSKEEEASLDRRYRDQAREAQMPDLSAHPSFQRTLTPTVHFQHGSHARRCVRLLSRMAGPGHGDGAVDGAAVERVETSRYLEIPFGGFASDSGDGGDKRKRPLDAAHADSREGNAGGGNQPKRRKVTPGKARGGSAAAAAPAARRKPAAPKKFSAPSRMGDRGGDEPCGSRPPAAKKKMAPAAKRGPRKGKRAGKRGGIDSDEIGDDCERDSDMNETDGSDDGADLVDFVVSDDHELSAVEEPDLTQPGATGAKRVWDEMDNSTADELFTPGSSPPTSTVRGGGGKPGLRSDGTATPVASVARRRQRITLPDSDEDE